MGKICTKCGVDKSIEDFHTRLASVDGKSPICKPCARARSTKWQRENSEQAVHNARIWAKENREKSRVVKSRWAKNNPGYQSEYCKSRRANDIEFRLSRVLRSRLSSVLRGGDKKGSAVRDLGCTLAELKTYLADRFTPGMSWDNYGAWHIDHVRPLASFNLQDRAQFLQACHYTNLQPLWAADNQAKGAKWIGANV